jgi:hypothetical protein
MGAIMAMAAWLSVQAAAFKAPGACRSADPHRALSFVIPDLIRDPAFF